MLEYRVAQEIGNGQGARLFYSIISLQISLTASSTGCVVSV